MAVAIRGRNVLGEALAPCCRKPVTGFFRDGFCRSGEADLGTHVVCAEVTDEFLKFSLARGNDLITPHPEFEFPGLKVGDCWCLCVQRWKEAMQAGVAPPVRLDATHEKALEFVTLDDLRRHVRQ